MSEIILTFYGSGGGAKRSLLRQRRFLFFFKHESRTLFVRHFIVPHRPRADHSETISSVYSPGRVHPFHVRTGKRQTNRKRPSGSVKRMPKRTHRKRLRRPHAYRRVHPFFLGSVPTICRAIV